MQNLENDDRRKVVYLQFSLSYFFLALSLSFFFFFVLLDSHTCSLSLRFSSFIIDIDEKIFLLFRRCFFFLPLDKD